MMAMREEWSERLLPEIQILLSVSPAGCILLARPFGAYAAGAEWDVWTWASLIGGTVAAMGTAEWARSMFAEVERCSGEPSGGRGAEEVGEIGLRRAEAPLMASMERD